MALFGKKKKAEATAPQIDPATDIEMVGDLNHDDLDDSDGDRGDSAQTIDFDAIAQDLNAREDGADMDSFLGQGGAQNAPAAPDFAGAPDFATGNANANIDDELDFDSTFDNGAFDDGTLVAPAPPVASAATDENPFGADSFGDNSFDDNSFGESIDIEPVAPEPALAGNAPPLTHTAPLLTSDVAAGGHASARRSLPLLPLLGAAGLLLALGAVGYWVFAPKADPVDEAAPVTNVVATNAMAPGATTTGAMTPGVTTPGALTARAVPAPGASGNAVNQGIAVDGVPIAPGVVFAPAALGAPSSMAPSPAMMAQLKALWKKGAAAKQAKNYAGARAAWTQMQRLRPNNADVQSAIDKLPAS